MPEITEVTVAGEEVESGGAPPTPAPSPALFDAICGITEGDYTGSTAITDAITAGARVIGITPGTYDITATALYPDNLTLYGIGNREDIVLDGSNLATYREFGSSTRIENLTFLDVTIRTQPYTRDVCINNIIYDNLSTGRYLFYSGTTGAVNNLSITNSYFKRGRAFQIIAGGRIEISNCHFNDLDAKSYFYGRANSSVHFTDNTFENCHSLEFSYIDNPYDCSYNVQGNIVKGNTGLNTWTANTTYNVGDKIIPTTPNTYYYKVIATTGTKKSGAVEPTWPTTVDETVVDNEITLQMIGDEDNVNYGFLLWEVKGNFCSNEFLDVWGCEIRGGNELIFDNNVIIGITKTDWNGITIDNTSVQTINSSFSGNKIKGTDATYSGIYLKATGLDSCTISNNSIKDVGYGIYFPRLVNNCTIIGNTVEECVAGIIQDYQMQDSVVSNNTIVTTNGTTSDAGISIASVSSENNMIIGNVIEGPFHYGIYSECIKSSFNMNAIKDVRATTGYGIYHANAAATNLDISFNRIDGAPGGSEIVENSVSAQKLNNLIY